MGSWKWDKETLLKIAKQIYEKRGSLTCGVWKEELGYYPNGSIIREYGSLKALQSLIIPEVTVTATKPTLSAPQKECESTGKICSESEMKQIFTAWLKQRNVAYAQEHRIRGTKTDFFIKTARKDIAVEIKSCKGRPSGCQGYITGLGQALYASRFIDEVWLIVPYVVARHLNSIDLPPYIHVYAIDAFLPK